MKGTWELSQFVYVRRDIAYIAQSLIVECYARKNTKSPTALNLILNKFQTANTQSRIASRTQMLRSIDKAKVRLDPVLLEWLTTE